ncbi:MAG: hypothetical protein RI953_646 [Pseudomonadota bacterium]|jgi:outer membrane PBP1 activator LpoA protein
MLKLATAIVSGLVFVSCGKSNASGTEVDAQTASTASSANLVVKCRSTADARTVSALDTIELTVAGNSVSLSRTLVQKAGDAQLGKSQRLKGTINSVFDFNRISENSAHLLLNPTSLSTTVDLQTTTQALTSALIEYSQGRLKISQRDGKVLISHSNCRTLSANLTTVKGMTPSNN